MEISTAKIEKIAKTLPIGYYAKRNITATVKEGKRTSYYSPMDDTIVISADIIKTAMKSYPEGYDEETAIRSMLYHEVSHAILTPKRMYITKIANIFEDERIETLLQDFYMDVDFKKQVFAINPEYHGQAPQDALDAFYQTVRFRNGHPDDLKRVEELIEQYSDLNYNNEESWYYEQDIRKLYEQIANRYNFPPKRADIYNRSQWTPQNESGNQQSKNQCQGQGQSNQQTNENNFPQKDGNVKGINSNNEKNPKTNISSKAMGNAIASFEQVTSKYTDKNLTDTIEMIFNSFNKRTTNNGSCTNGYSGIFDPHSVMRDDYKYFIRKNTRGNGKGFSKFNLNLFLDSSGSFNSNVEATNVILKSLADIEKSNPMFTFTLTTINWETKEWFGKDRVHFACGGSYLSDELLTIYNRKQRTDAVNYNIALFDGEMGNPKNFKAFNHNNCTIIAESSNSRQIKKYCPNAKLIEDNYNYTNNLKDNVLKILTIALG